MLIIELVTLNASMPYNKMGTQNELISDTVTATDECVPIFPNSPFNERKYFCLTDCRLHLTDFEEKTLRQENIIQTSILDLYTVNHNI